MRATTRIYAELVTADGRIDADAWRAAHAARSPVATCGACSGIMRSDPESPEYTNFFGVRWYSMRCDVCGSESSLPSTKILDTEVRRPSLAVAAAGVERVKAMTGDR
jgi:hypothetical protein